MKEHWSSEEDEILIDFVRVHEILYNLKHKEYRLPEVKQKLWCKVGKVLNKTPTNCYKRWCYVRDYYIRRKGKPGTLSSGEAAKKRANLLSFLDSFSPSQKNSITKMKVETPEDSQDSNEQTQFQNRETEDFVYINVRDISSDRYNNTDNDEEINKKFQRDGNKMRETLKRKNNSHAEEPSPQNEDNDSMHNAQRLQAHELSAGTPQPPQQNRNEDETDLFFSAMAKIVKQLPRYEQVQLRMKIGSLVGDAELRYITTDLPPVSVSPSPSTSCTNYSKTEMPSVESNSAATPQHYLRDKTSTAGHMPPP